MTQQFFLVNKFQRKHSTIYNLENKTTVHQKHLKYLEQNKQIVEYCTAGQMNELQLHTKSEFQSCGVRKASHVSVHIRRFCSYEVWKHKTKYVVQEKNYKTISKEINKHKIKESDYLKGVEGNQGVVCGYMSVHYIMEFFLTLCIFYNYSLYLLINIFGKEDTKHMLL